MKTTSTKTKLLTVLLALCMLLSLVPVSVLAAEPAAGTADFCVKSGTEAIDLLNQYKTGTALSSWDNSSKTLTLRGIEFTTTAQTAVKLPVGSTIVLTDGSHNFIQSGDVTINVSGQHNNQTFINALDAAGSLTIQGGTAGTGTLSVYAGKVKNEGDGWTFSSSITVNGDFTVKGGHVTARGGYIEGKDSVFSIGVNMDNNIKNKALLVTGGTLTAIAGESYEIQDDGSKRAVFSRGVYLYRGNVTVSGNSGLRAESVEKMADGGVLSNGLYISFGSLTVANSAEVAVAGAYGAYISGGSIALSGGRLLAVSTQTETSYGNALDVEAEKQVADSGNITVTGGTLETSNGKIYVSAYGATENQGVFTVTGGSIVNRDQIQGSGLKINISGGSVQTQGMDVGALTLSGGTLTIREPVRKSSYDGQLYASPALDVSDLAVSGGTLDAAWDWGKFTPIVFPVNTYYGYADSLVEMTGSNSTATFTGGTTTLDTGIAGNTALLVKGTLTLGQGMAETGADDSHRQTGTAPVKIAAAAASTAITAATIENAKFNYRPGNAPQATAQVTAADQDKYEIAYECWQQFENNNPVAAWYSDNGAHGSLPTITAFESGKTYVYSLMLKPKGGYSFSSETAITVNGAPVSAPFVGGSMYIPAVKTITMPTLTAIDVVEISGVTVSFKNGDTPVFTGKAPDGANYAYRCEWWELDSKTGAMSTDFGNFYENKVTAFEAGKTYHYGVYVTTYGDVGNVRYIFTPDTKLKINGEFVHYKRYEGDTSDGSDGTMWVITDLTMTPQAAGTTPEYKIIEGADGAWTKNTDGALTFRANGDFAGFTGVKVDGSLIAADQYTAVSGSTVITLKKEYLDTLSVGKHTLTVVYVDGECSTEFEIKAAQGGSGTTTPGKSPLSGADTGAAMWFGLLFISGVGLAILLLTKARKSAEG